MLTLINPTIKDQDQYLEMIKEWIEDGSYLCPDILEDKTTTKNDYKILLQRIENTKKGIHNDLDWYQFGHYLFLKEENEIIGVIAIRENLTELGENIWGNIALGIRPSKRKQGYAKKGLKLAIEKCKELKISPIIACHYIENNISPKLITACGGKYTNTVHSTFSNKEIKRYIFE